MDRTDSTDLRSRAYKAEDYCSTEEAAKVLGVSLRTIRLWVESGALQAWKTPGGHRRVTVRSLRKLVEERERVNRGSPPARAPATDTLLIVDDDADMLRLYELHIREWNLPLTLDFAHDGFDALLKIGEGRTALLVTDLNMPGMDGFRMVRTLRANKHYRDMPIVVVTGMDHSSIEALGLPRDIPVFQKPVAFADLRQAIEKRLAASAAASATQSSTPGEKPGHDPATAFTG